MPACRSRAKGARPLVRSAPSIPGRATGPTTTSPTRTIALSFAAALRESAWVPALVALGFATGFTHYLLDRGVYRLSDPQVRAAARGLLTPRRRS